MNANEGMLGCQLTKMAMLTRESTYGIWSTNGPPASGFLVRFAAAVSDGREPWLVSYPLKDARERRRIEIDGEGPPPGNPEVLVPGWRERFRRVSIEATISAVENLVAVPSGMGVQVEADVVLDAGSSMGLEPGMRLFLMTRSARGGIVIDSIGEDWATGWLSYSVAGPGWESVVNRGAKVTSEFWAIRHPHMLPGIL